MTIDYGKLRSLKARQLMRALKKDGFREYKRKGVTRFFSHPDGRTTTIHLHNLNQTFAIGTLQAIIELQVRWTEDDLRRLGLLR